MASRAQTRQEHDLIVDGVVAIVSDNLADRHELGRIAADLNYSERQLRRILAERDIAWRPWLAEQRMRRAAELLLTGRYVRHVAPKVGYKADHFAAPFATYCGLLPAQARRVGYLRTQLMTLRRRPPRSADVAANCRAIDAWDRLWREAVQLQLRARPATPVALALLEAVQCVPARRPRPAPRGRRRRQETLAGMLLAFGDGSENAAADVTARGTFNEGRTRRSGSRGA